MKRYLALSIVLLAGGLMSTTNAQDAEQAKKQKATSGELYDTIAGLDAQVFGAFNAGEVEPLMAMFADDLEFYDDGGDGGAKTYAEVKELWQGI